MRLYDAHNHLQDDRLAGRQAECVAAAVAEGVVRMVVNGACERDWPLVLELARAHPQVLPSFGCHPWYVGQRSPEWRQHLIEFLDQVPSAVGEIGLDRWKPGLTEAGQEEVFLAQLELASARNLPLTIHCLQAWGRLFDLLRAHPRPERGFLLHSFCGPREMVAPLAKLGAYFSFPGYFLHDRKTRQRETFRHIPAERLLIETDAPDQLPPAPPLGDNARNSGEPSYYPLVDPKTGQPINHPANLAYIYHGLAAWLGRPVEELAAQVEVNFLRLFGEDFLCRTRPGSAHSAPSRTPC